MPPAVMQLGGSSSPTASPTPPLLIRVCLPTAWKGQEGSPSSVKCRTNPPEFRTLPFPTPLSLSCTAPQQVPLLPSTCSLQLLTLPTLTVRANLQQKCHMKPPSSCRPHAWPLTTQKERDRPGAPLSAMLVPPIPQGPTALTQHSAGSKTVLPAPAWPQGNQGSPCGFTQFPKWATAAVHTQVPFTG